MKKSILIASILAGLSGMAAAQSSVTVFGTIDMGVRQVHENGQDQTQVAPNGNTSTSAIGFRGLEDLGDGMKASFWLESQIAPNTGAAGAITDASTTAPTFWNRRATVSLTGDFGEVRLGRDKTAIYNQQGDFDVFGTVGLGAVTNVQSALGSGANTAARADNTVSYFLPGNLDGIYGQLQGAPGEGVQGNKMVSGRLGWTDGTLNVSGAFNSTDVLAGHWQLGSLAASYDFGVVKLLGSVSESKLNSYEQTIYDLGANIPVGPGSILIKVTRSEANSSAQLLSGVGSATMFAGGYQYHLSKRTDLYVMGGEINNSGKGTFTVATQSGVSAKGGDTSAAWNVGITTKF